MNILLVGINAKYIHTNLAIRLLKEYAKTEHNLQVEEFTINQSVEHILSEIHKKEPQLLCFSCYIWNIETVMKLVKAYKKINPSTRILLGGPEVSYDIEMWMQNDGIDYIIYSEGEETFKELLETLPINGFTKEEMVEIDGLALRSPSGIIINKPREPLNMDDLPFVYDDSYLENHNQILYYESQRGCPFNCQYCLSSIEKGVRFKNLELVKKELDIFLAHKVKQVKFVDRTFNSNKAHAMGIWAHLIEKDNGVTNFHFEIAVELLGEEELTLIKKARAGLFQFEIGVQSTHKPTLELIKRKSDFNHLSETVKKLKSFNNIHLHLDLIAGLPKEGLNEFKKSFNDVYGLHPEQLQLGFLKVLRGSGIAGMCREYGIEYHDTAPYEVLKTNMLSYDDICQLKLVEQMLETFYNSGQYRLSIAYLERFFEKPYDLYEKLAKYYEAHGYHHISHSKLAYSEMIIDFGKGIESIDIVFLKEALKMDMYLVEKLNKFPNWMDVNDDYREAINEFYKDESNISRYLPQLLDYSSKQISRMVHIEVFEYDLTKYLDSEFEIIDKQRTAILFNYYDRDRIRHQASINSVKIY